MFVKVQEKIEERSIEGIIEKLNAIKPIIEPDDVKSQTYC